ncbi:WD40 repeat domain-containing protein [Streptomyces venezuelae]|uniref:WD40 repeat domain-containing protein n=1 Tax=Streptomyces venezuelae TaxID=54571 RepID=UPI001CC23171|nr:WD40 repeat domain-containing protein [Streptomyces venezuelae]
MNGSEDGEREPRRYLIATVVAEYLKNRDWNRPELLEARTRVVDLFTGPLGYRLHDPLPQNPTGRQLTDALRAFCTSPERREDDLLTIYLSCHGEILDDGEEHVLLTADTDPEDLTYTALPTADLTRAVLRGSRIRRVLLLLDACYVGQGGNQLAAGALQRLGAAWGRSSGSGLVVVSSAQPDQAAATGTFPKLLEEAVTSLSVAGHAPRTLPVDALVQHMNASNDLPGHQRIGVTMVGLDGEPPAFFPNPRHDIRLTEVDLAVQRAAAFDEQDRRRETEFTSRLLVRAMGDHGGAGATAWWFSGRRTALSDLASWLNDRGGGDRSVCRVVTAGPGSGKTAVLGLVAALTHPERRRTVPLHTLDLPTGLLDTDAVDAAVYAQRLTDTDVLEAVCAAARVRAGTVGELLEALGARTRPLTVLIDALDEAATPGTLCSAVLRPLIEHSGGRIRLLLGTRPYLLPRLGIGPADTIDLDDARYADPEALAVYAARNLLEAHATSPYRDRIQAVRPVAEAVARAAGHSFLIARLTAGTLAAAPGIPDADDPAWRASLPRHAGDAMRHDLRQRLGDDARRATDLLRPLAYSQGQGLPWEDVWAPLATAISGRTYTDDDLVWLRDEAGSYVVEATENGRSAYRLYHEAMAEYLREGTEPRTMHAAYTRVLTARVPWHIDVTQDWSRAHPYALAHLAHHAAQAGCLDGVLASSEYLVHAEPRGLTPYLHSAHGDTARLAAAVYRTGLHLHKAVTPHTRRQTLALDAARAGAPDLHRSLTSRIPPGEWAPVWATGSTFNPALRDTLSGHTGSVYAVACAELGGRPLAVTTGQDGTVRVWDLATGRTVGRPLTGHTGSVHAVACTELDGRPLAVTTGQDGTVRVWDLATGRTVGRPLTGHTGSVHAVACTELDGRPLAVTTGEDGTVRVWDLATGHAIGSPLTGHTGWVQAVACTRLDGRPIAVTGGYDRTVRLWDLATGHAVGRPLAGHTGPVHAVACTERDGRPVAVTTGQDRTARVWDLAAGHAVGKPLTGHTGWVHAVACTERDGLPVAVTTGEDGTVRLWDLATGDTIGKPLTGHSGAVHAVACTALDGRPVAVTTGANDKTARVWDLDARHTVGEALFGHSGRVQSVACTERDGRPVAVTTGADDKSAHVWDLTTGLVVDSLTGHLAAVRSAACTGLDGPPVAVTGANDKTARSWDLATGRPFGPPLTSHLGAVTVVACTEIDGRPVVATTGENYETVRLWDLVTGRIIGKPLTGHSGWVHGVACTRLEGRPVAVTTGEDRTVRVWDLGTHRPVGEPLTGHVGAVHAVACTELDGRAVAVTTGAKDDVVRVWDLATGQSIGKPLVGHSDGVRTVACAVLDGRPVAATGGYDDTVRIWDLRTWSVTATILLSQPNAVAFTATGDLVIGFHNDIALFRRKPHAP